MCHVVPVNEAWRAELQALKDIIKLPPLKSVPRTPKRPWTSQYSEETGRLIPPPSRAGSRGGPSRNASRDHLISRLGNLDDNPDVELQV